MGDSYSDSRCHPVGGQHGYGLLGVLHETAWLLLCSNHWYNSRNSFAMGVSQSARKQVDAPRLHRIGGCRRLSTDGYLCTGCRRSDGGNHMASYLINVLTPHHWHCGAAKYHRCAIALLSFRLLYHQSGRYLSNGNTHICHCWWLSLFLYSLLCAGCLLPADGYHLSQRVEKAGCQGFGIYDICVTPCYALCHCWCDLSFLV